MVRLIVLAVWLAALAAAQAPFRYEIRRMEKKSPSCSLSFEYLEITSAASVEVRDRLNAGILKLMLRRAEFPGDDSGMRSLDAYSAKYIKECSAYHEWVKGTPPDHPMYEHKVVKLLRSAPPVFSFQLDASADSGGVHPFGTIFYLNLDSSTGRPVTLADVLRPGAMPRLAALAERNFRKDQGLSPIQSLSESAFNFPGDKFTLNDNYAFGDRALIFLFNTYEFSAGSMGPTELRIDYADMPDLLKPAFGLLPH